MDWSKKWESAEREWEQESAVKRSNPSDIVEGMVPLRRGGAVDWGPGVEILDGGNIGKGITLTAADTLALSPEGRTILEVSGDEKNAQTCSITLFKDSLPVATGAPQTCRALVTFGSGGSRATLLMDYLNGLAFSVGSASIRVSVVADPRFQGAPFEGVYFANAAYGSPANNTVQPQLTLTRFGPEFVSGTFPLIPGAVAVFTIPLFCESFRVYTVPESPIEIQVTEPPIATPVLEKTFGIIGSDPDPQIYLPNTGSQIRITNQGLANIDVIRIVCRLAL